MSRASFAVAGMAMLVATPTIAQENPFVDTNPVRGFYLRGNFAVPSLLGSPDRSAKARGKDQFLLSFDIDDLAGTETIRAKGALFWSSRRNHVSRKNLKISSINAGIYIDHARVDGERSNDLVQFRFGGSWMWSTSNPDVNWKNHFLTADLGWATDTRGDVSVATADLAYVPLGSTPGFGGADLFLGSARVQFNSTLRAHAQKVIKSGGKAQFTGPQEAAFIGAGLRADLRFAEGPFRPLILSAGIEGMHSLTSGRDSTDRIHASATWLLSEEANVGLVLSYDKGRTPTTAESDKVSVSIGFSF